MHIVLSVTNRHYYAMRNVYYWSITNNIIVTQCYMLLKKQDNRHGNIAMF